MTLPLSTFLSRLRDIRVCLGFTQDTMAGQLGISRRTYLRRENGEFAFGQDELTKTAELGDVTLEWLVNGHPMPLTAKALGGRIRQARRNALISVSAFAEMLDGTTEWQVLEIESGGEPCPTHLLVHIAAIVGVDPKSLHADPSAPIQKLSPLAEGYRPIPGKHLGISEVWAHRVGMPKGVRSLELDSAMEPLFPAGSILIWKPEKPREALQEGTFWVVMAGVPCLRKITISQGNVTSEPTNPAFTQHQSITPEDLLGRPLWIMRPFPENP